MKSYKSLAALVMAVALAGAPSASSHIATANADNLRRIARQDGDDPTAAEQELFLQAQRLYEKNQYDQAVKVLQELLRTYPQSSITDLTLLWLARSYIGLNDLREAERIGDDLRKIKDTPFLDIYQTELADARRKAGVSVENTTASSAASANGQTAAGEAAAAPAGGNPTLAANTETPPQPNPSTPQATPTATPVPRLVTAERPRVAEATPSSRNSDSGSNSRRNANGTDRSRRRDLAGPRRIVRVAPDGTTTTSTQTPTGSAAPVASNSTPTTAVPESASPTVNDPALAETPISGQSGIAPGGGGLSITIKQVPNLSLALRNATLPATPGQSVAVPLVITNTGNREDQFRVETDLPAEYQPTFSTAQGASDTGLPILVTPQVPRGGTYEVQLNLRVPETAGDGLQRRFLVRAASQFDTQVERVADASLNVIAASLGATSAVSQPSVQPNETFSQTIQIRNQGSAPARAARAEFVFDPDFELISANPSPLVYDRASRTAVWSLGEMASRDGREVTVSLRAVGNALAATKPLGRGTLRTASLPVGSNFDGPSVTVGRVSRAGIDAISAGLTATPGDTLFIPFVVRNPSNYPESFELRVVAPGAPAATVFADTNGDGQHQENESAVTQTSPIAPRGGQYPVLLRIEIPRTTPDRQQFGYNIVARSLTNNRVASEGSTVLTVAAPRVRIRTEQVGTSGEAGDTIFYRLVLVNEGAGLARNLVVTEQLPAELQFVSSDPSLNPQDAPGDAHRLTWRVADLAPGDTSVLRIAVRLRPGLNANTTVQTRPSLVYQDTNGNSHRGQ